MPEGKGSPCQRPKEGHQTGVMKHSWTPQPLSTLGAWVLSCVKLQKSLCRQGHVLVGLRIPPTNSPVPMEGGSKPLPGQSRTSFVCSLLRAKPLCTGVLRSLHCSPPCDVHHTSECSFLASDFKTKPVTVPVPAGAVALRVACPVPCPVPCPAE